MTPYELAQDLLTTALESVEEPPEEQFAQLGAQVANCPSVIAAVTGVQPSPLPNCACGLATAVITVTRDCGGMVYNEDGTNNVEGIAKASAIQEADGDALKDTAEKYIEATDWSIGWVIEGNLFITSLSISLPLPCGPYG